MADSYASLDAHYIALDRLLIRRSGNLGLIPGATDRRGGKRSYAEWAHVVGIFQTLMYLHLESHENNDILDVGCGTGLLGIASEPFLGRIGRYVGMDVMRDEIDFCRAHYPRPKFEFIHFDMANPEYTPDQRAEHVEWPWQADRFDLVTALSVWTHLNEADAYFYLRETARVLRPGGKAIITFFVLDDQYYATLPQRNADPGRYHRMPRNLWIFDRPAYDSQDWMTTPTASVPESAIGVTQAGMDRLIADAGLCLAHYYSGNWKERPGVYFQDVLILSKP